MGLILQGQEMNMDVILRGLLSPNKRHNLDMRVDLTLQT